MTLINRLILHHSGGGYFPNHIDRAHYHGITDVEGVHHMGDHDYAANSADRRLLPGQHAAHTWHLNGGSAGEAIAAMGGSEQAWSAPYGGPFPISRDHMLHFLQNVAVTAKRFRIPQDARNILTHAEVEPRLGVKQRNKWDFDYWPLNRGIVTRDPLWVGDAMREVLFDFMDRVELADASEAAPDFEIPGTLSQGDRGEDVRALQALVGSAVDGAFGPNTYRAVKRFQRSRGLLVDGIVGKMTWAALLAPANP